MKRKTKREEVMKRFFLKLILIFITTISVISLISYFFLTDISFQEGFSITAKQGENKKGRVIKIGVVSRYSPSLIYDGYQPVIDFLNQNTNHTFELVLSKDYVNTVQKLKDGDIDFAFLGDMIFIEYEKKLNLIPVVCPVNKNGEPFLNVVTIVKDNSNIKNFCQLNGKEIAIPSKSSFSSKWAYYKVKQCGIKVKIKRFNFHHTVVLQVLNGRCDAGVVREYVAEEFLKNGIKIIDFSPPIPSPPLVTTSKTDKGLINEIQKALLKFKGFKRENTLIDREFYDGFTIPPESLYSNFEIFLKKRGLLDEK